MGDLKDTILRISHFAAKPGKTKIGLEEIVDGFARLGEPPQVVDSLRQLLTPILNTCAGEDGNCFPSPWTTGDLKRYFSKQEVITRLVQNLFFHEDLQFPTWNLED